MAENLENIIRFLNIVGDFNPVHRDAKKAYELASLIKDKNSNFNAIEEQIVPGLYFASRILCMHEHRFDVGRAEFEFKHPFYLSSNTFIEGAYLFADKSLAIKGSFYKQDECKAIPMKEVNQHCESKITEIDKTILKEFAESLGIGMYGAHDEKRALKALAGSLISGALWKCAENMKEKGFGLYNRQIWHFHKAPKYGIFVAKAGLKKAREPFYFFDTVVEQENEAVVSGEAVCIFLKKQ